MVALPHSPHMRRGGGINPPPEVLLSWPAPNYANPVTHDWSGAIVLIVLLSLTIGVFGARLCARLLISKNAGLDDILISAAMLPLIGLTIAAVLGIRIYGFQWHAWDQTATTYITTREITLSIELLYMGATALTKISILCFYRRMSSGSISRVFIYGVWGLILSVVAYFIVFAFVIIFTCTPVEGFWRYYDLVWRTQNEMHCHDEGVIIVTIVVISTLQDFIICALPAVLVWNLQIPKRQKMALVALFGAGVLTCICGIMRTYYAIYVYFFTYDITWYAYYGWVWTAIESDLGVICACAPAMKVFFLRYFQYTTQSGSKGTRNSTKPKTLSSMGCFKKPYGQLSGQYSAGVTTIGSHGESKKDSLHCQGIPLDRIQVRSHTDIRVDEFGGRSSMDSQSSTRILRAPPLSPTFSEEPPVNWVGSRTTCKRSSNSQGDPDMERMTGAIAR
ncbi:unnamed protein product [Periconia digitata]|uniref:Rhodopsin domain-containing protein n=1 Tax=Periconia digitata TaxID=1303443 RepID=A0A9W4ULH4_9PLEO|nr:unnamed protein product [Periconia digitata]